MTVHEKAMLAGVFGVIVGANMVVVSRDYTALSFVSWVVLVPFMFYGISRLVQIAARIQITVIPHLDYIPRCRICESDHKPYTVSRKLTEISEHWNTTHEHRVEKGPIGTLTCQRGHYIAFRETTDTRKSKYRKGSVHRLAMKLRALRAGFHNIHVESVETSLDA